MLYFTLTAGFPLDDRFIYGDDSLNTFFRY